MKILSLYCGAGGIDEGLKQAGIKTTLAVDYDSDCCKTMKQNHPDCEVIHGTVKEYLSSLSQIDIIVGGPPCPEFSRANTNRTFDMCEVNNFWEAVEKTKPIIYLMENVQDIKKKLIKNSYLLNCADYGVAQNRIRRFFTNLPCPITTHSKNPQQNLFGNTLKKWVSVRQALDFLDDKKWMSKIESNSPTNQNHKIYSNKYLKEKNPIMYEKHKPTLLDSVSYNINAKDRSTPSEFISDGINARKLTNTELSVLQGFPKYYKFYGGITSTRKQIGNAVPPPIIKAFFEKIK